VYRVFGLEHVQVSEKDQISRLMRSIQKDEYTDAKAKAAEDGEEASEDKEEEE